MTDLYKLISFIPSWKRKEFFSLLHTYPELAQASFHRLEQKISAIQLQDAKALQRIGREERKMILSIVDDLKTKTIKARVDS